MNEFSLLESLVCPKCKGELEIKREDNRLICPKCRLKYKIENGIPIMLIDQAEKYKIADKEKK
jgi:uncharacterized protein YbaR (Trm112 family)